MKKVKPFFSCVLRDIRFYQKITSKRELTFFSSFLIFFSPRFIPVFIYRISYFLYTIHLTPVAKLFSLFNYFCFGLEISVSCKIGHSFYMPHTRGTVIGAQSIGDFAIIYHGVTIGATFIDIDNTGDERPVIGDNVKIATGAVVIGKIKIGDNVAIAPNVVLRESVMSNHMVTINNSCMVITDRKIKENE